MEHGLPGAMRAARSWALPALIALLTACAGPQAVAPRDEARIQRGPPASGDVLARNDRWLIYQAGPRDSFASIAERFLGDARKAWRVADFGDNALVFQVLFWLRARSILDRRQLESDLRYRIDELFREAGIEVAATPSDMASALLRIWKR